MSLPRPSQTFDEIIEYIAKDNIDAALDVYDGLRRAMRKLADMPGLGRSRDELVEGLRRFPVGKYLIFYRRATDGVQIIRVLHGGRNLKRLFKRRR